MSLLITNDKEVSHHRLQHLRQCRDACRTGGQEAQCQLVENELGPTWALLEELMAAHQQEGDKKEEEEQTNKALLPPDALRRLTLTALQFLANVGAGNPITSKAVFQHLFPSHFLTLLETYTKDRGLLMCVCVIIHNYLACAGDDDKDKTQAVTDLLSSPPLLSKLLRIIILAPSPPSATHTNTQEEEKYDKEDPVFEWVYLIVCKILAAKQGKPALEKAGLSQTVLLHLKREREEEKDDIGVSGGLLPIFTAEQLVLLHVFEQTLEDAYVNGNGGSSSDSSSSSGENANILIKDGGALISELVQRVHLFVEEEERRKTRPELSSSSPAEWKMMEEGSATIIRLLGSLLGQIEHTHTHTHTVSSFLIRDTLVDQGLVKLTLTLLHREGGKADGVIPASFSPSHTHTHIYTSTATSNQPTGRKAHLIRLLGNLAHTHTHTQDTVRLLGGLPLVLNHCNVDSHNLFLREWALFTLRNLCEGNEANQQEINRLKPQETIQTHTLKEMGLEPQLVTGEDGKVRVTVKRDPHAHAQKEKDREK